MNIFKYEKFGDIRNIKIFNIIKISYNTKRKYLKGLKVKNLGENNIFNCRNRKSAMCKNSSIVIHGSNNRIEFGENIKFTNCYIEIWGDNVVINIGNNCILNNVYGVFGETNDIEDNTKIVVGNNFQNIDNLQLFAGGSKNTSLEIGNDCLFSRNITIYAHDGHKIYDKETNRLINTPKNSLKIGNNVWIGQNVNILKGSHIPNNTVVGAGSVITRVFTEENTSIAGNPASVLTKNIRWEK